MNDPSSGRDQRMPGVVTSLAGWAHSYSKSLRDRLQTNQIVTPVLVFLITRSLLFIVAYLGRVAFLESIGDAVDIGAPDNLILNIWDRWDSAYYRSIADAGYAYIETDPGNVPFFPLYPLLLAAASPLFNHLTAAGIFVSNLCFLGALVLLYRLCLFEFGDKDVARRTLYYLALFPASFFFSAVYSESTFLLFSVATVYAIRRRRWLAGGILGALASAARSAGVLLYGFALLEWLAIWWQRRQTAANGGNADPAPAYAPLLFIHLIPMGMGLFMLHLWQRFGDPLVFASAQKYWGRDDIVFPLAPLWRDFSAIFRQSFFTGDTYMWRVSLDAIAGVAVLLLVFWIWRHLGVSYAAYTAGAVLLPLATGTTMSLLRYVLPLFPVFMILALWGRRHTVDRALTIAFTLLLALLTTVFVNWGFVA